MGSHGSSSFPPGSGGNALAGDSKHAKELKLEIPVKPGVLRSGGNEIRLSSLAGGWVIFDQVLLEGLAPVKTVVPGMAFVRGQQQADYEVEANGGRFQPLLVDVEHLTGTPRLSVQLDGQEIFAETLEAGRHILEVPMPAVASPKRSQYRIAIDGKVTAQADVRRAPQLLATPADYVDTRLGTAHSRWMIAPGPWMPFSMVKLSPDNQNAGWQAGYDPTFESIGTFSHIHEWTMGGWAQCPPTVRCRLR